MPEVIIHHLAIVAGGRGTRLEGIAGGLPKSLVPVGGKPVLQHQLDWAAAYGIKEVTILGGHGAELLAAYVAEHPSNLDIRLMVEGQPLGNAGALLAVLDSFPDHFFVVYGDVMVAVNLERLAHAHFENNADFTTLAHPNDHPFDSDLLETNTAGFVTAIHTAPHVQGQIHANLVNAALYAVRHDALRPFVHSGEKQDFTHDVLPGLIGGGARVLAYRSMEYIKDMGTPERLCRVEADLRAGRLARSAAPAPAIFLDRDGTLNRERGFLSATDDFELLPGVAQALRRLRHAGYRLVIVTNQPVIARGEASEETIASIHRRLEWELGLEGAFVDAIYLCPHHPDKGYPGERSDLKMDCECRKPKPGLVLAACRDLDLDPARSWMIGDRTGDIELARRAGLRSVLVETGACGRDGCYDAAPDFRAHDMMHASECIIMSSGERAS